MTIYALPASVRGCLIPAIVAVEEQNITEEFCFLCGRCTDHRGEHSDKQILTLLAEINTHAGEDFWESARIEDCISEFGPHEDHSDCQRIIGLMNDPGEEPTDYSAWYGGEQGYNDGLRWSDFV